MRPCAKLLGLAQKDMGEGCTLKVPAIECHQDESYLLLADMPLCDHYTVHAKCTCNQILAATNRVICQWPQPEDGALGRLRGIAKRMGDYLGRRQMVAPEEWTAKYSGYKRARYERAIREWEVCGVNRKHSYVNAFVKAEKITDPRKDPRMIQARNPVYNVALGNYLKAFEHDLYNVQGVRQLKNLFPQGRLIAKGLNMVQRGALLSKRWGELTQPVALELDCSRFDAHCSEQLLRIEHLVYKRCFPKSRELQRLLEWQIHNKCFTEGGVRYTCEGRRMSGDMNTALGNCVLMLILLADAFKQCGVPPKAFRIVDDGDDCVVLVEKEYQSVVTARFPLLFRSYGHELKIESVTEDFSKVTLCGSRVVRVGGVRKCILNPRRTIGKSRIILPGANVQNYNLNRYVSTVGQCLLALHSGVPVLQSHALALRRADRRVLKSAPGSFVYRFARDQDWADHQPEPVTDEARLDFQDCFGVSIPDQLALERWFDGCDVFDDPEVMYIESDHMGVKPMYEFDGF